MTLKRMRVTNAWFLKQVKYSKLKQMKEQNKNKTIGVDAFCDRLNEIFKAGMITKAQIIDAYNKSVDEAMPTGEAERDDAEDFLSTKDIWNHPRITDRCDKESYEVADLMAEFATAWFRNHMGEKFDGNKSIDESMPTAEERDKAAIDCIRNNDMLYELVIFKAGWDTCIKYFRNHMNSSEKLNSCKEGGEK